MKAFPLLNGTKILPPFFIWTNIVEITRIGTVLLLKHLPKTLGYVSIVFNIAVIILLTWKFIKERKYRIKFTFLSYCLSILAESILFLFLGVYSTNVEKYIVSESFTNLLITASLVWIGLSLVTTILMLILPNHQQMVERVKPSKNKV